MQYIKGSGVTGKSEMRRRSVVSDPTRPIAFTRIVVGLNRNPTRLVPATMLPISLCNDATNSGNFLMNRQPRSLLRVLPLANLAFDLADNHALFPVVATVLHIDM